MDYLKAADAADAFLADEMPGTRVLRDPADVFEDDDVFVFLRVPAALDDQILVVEKASGTVRFVMDSPFTPNPYPNLVPLASDEA